MYLIGLRRLFTRSRLEASIIGGCVCKMTSEYRTKGDVYLLEEIKQGKGNGTVIYVVEEYLV